MVGALVIFGATGYTGALIARRARACGLGPVLCGRNPEKLRALAGELGVEYRLASFDRPASWPQALRGAAVLLNAAGPFAATAAPVMAACLEQGVHYLDIAGEVAAFQTAAGFGPRARRRGVMVMPGVGFDVVPSDCLAAQLVSRVRRPRRLSLGVSGLTLMSRGSARTMIKQIADPVQVRRAGELTTVAPGTLERSFDFGKGPVGCVAVSWGDVVSAYYTVGAPDITVYFEATIAVRLHTSLVRLFGWAVPYTPWQSWLESTVAALPQGPSESERAATGAVIVGEVEDDSGVVYRGRLHTPEAYTFTGNAAVAIAARVLAGDVEPGFQTPARVYGPELVSALPGVLYEEA